MIRPTAKQQRLMQARRARLAYAAGSLRNEPAWRPESKSEDAIWRQDAATLRGRARDVVANVPHLAGALERIVNNVVSTGIWPQVADNKASSTRIESAFHAWGNHSAIRYVELQELVLRHLWVDGGCFVVHGYDADMLRQGLCPLVLRGLEYDYLDTSIHGTQASGYDARNGIEFDRLGRPVAYHLYETHPGDSGFRGQYIQGSQRVPADWVHHIFLPRRFSQSIGISWLASVLMLVNAFNDYQSSELIAARIAAKFGLFIKSDFPDMSLGGIPDASEYPEGSELAQGLEMEAGTIQQLPNGFDVIAPTWSRPGDQFEPFSKLMLRRQSAALGMSYEAFSNDYTGASYSSARSASLEERRGYERQQHILGRLLLQPICQLWAQAAYVAGIIRTQSITWTQQYPGWPWVDPVKDAQAALIRVDDLKVSSRSREAAKLGSDFFEELERRKAEREAMEAAGESMPVQNDEPIKEDEEDAETSDAE